jgi:hypothetical protein
MPELRLSQPFHDRQLLCFVCECRVHRCLSVELPTVGTMQLRGLRAHRTIAHLSAPNERLTWQPARLSLELELTLAGSASGRASRYWPRIQCSPRWGDPTLCSTSLLTGVQTFDRAEPDQRDLARSHAPRPVIVTGSVGTGVSVAMPEKRYPCGHGPAGAQLNIGVCGYRAIGSRIPRKATRCSATPECPWPVQI